MAAAMGRFAVLLLLVACAASSAGRLRGVVDPVVEARPVLLDPADPARRRVGALTYLGGWVLSGRDGRFGGWSTLKVSGDRVVSVSDAGAVLHLHLANGRVLSSSVDDLSAGPADGQGKANRDVESMTWAPDGSAVWLGFEHANAIWRYDRGFRATGHVAPKAMEDWPSNSGPEAMVRLRNGRFLIFSEDHWLKGGGKEALLFASDPVEGRRAPLRFAYQPPAGYLPTDAAELPDGRVVLLNRRVSLLDGFSAVVTLVDPRAIVAGKILVPVELARLAPPLTVDNMEGLSVTVENGRPVLWLISDDNFMAFERTLLLKFRLDRLPARPR
jgi:hypothetical protein